MAAGVAGGGAVRAGGGRGPGGPAGARRPAVARVARLGRESCVVRRRPCAAGARRRVAATVAVVAFLLTPDAEARWLRHLLQGNIEPVTAALCVWAVRRHLDGRPGQAVLLGALAGLTRPEAWPFLVLYAAWLLWRAPRRWWVLVPALPAVPVLWFGGDRLRLRQRARRVPRRRRCWLGTAGAAAGGRPGRRAGDGAGGGVGRGGGGRGVGGAPPACRPGPARRGGARRGRPWWW